jgi:hypothetical protein
MVREIMEEDIIKVVCVFGEFKKGKDFVLEPPCNSDCDCKICKQAFYIKKERFDTIYQIIILVVISFIVSFFIKSGMCLI